MFIKLLNDVVALGPSEAINVCIHKVMVDAISERDSKE